MHKLIWEFKPKSGRHEQFERAYAADGSWSSLFRRASGYLGTELLRKTDDEGTYLTIDSWRSKDDFAAFKEAWKSEYEALDKESERLTASETPIGIFSAADGAPGQAPTLETERLMLRSHGLQDFDACAAMWADPLVTQYIGGTPSSRQQTWARLMNFLGHWLLLGFGYWAVVEKATGQYIGGLGFADFKRDMEPSIEGTPELGWALATSAHGKGYATEALRAIVAWGDVHLQSRKTVCTIHPDNSASIRVAEKLGYRELQRATYTGETMILFARG